MTRLLVRMVVVAASLLLGAPGTPAAPAARPGRTAPAFTFRVDPALRGWFRFPAYRRFRGRRIPGGPEAAARLGRVGVSVRLRRASDLDALRKRTDEHLALVEQDGRIAALGSVVAARVTAVGLERLARLAFVQRVELDMVSPMAPPLDVTGTEVQADAVWRTLDAVGLPVSGAGVVIADLDSGIDPLHPAFFRADGGTYDWLDADGDGRFVPGVDAVDLNRNGQVDPGERVRFFDALVMDLSRFQPILGSDNGQWDIGVDYLYADLNGNAERDYGPAGGYGDEDPTLGEPLFVADDVNGNGALDPGERLVALGTSKVWKVYGGSRTYVRGESLLEVPVTNDALHGTGVAGILVGGQRGYSRSVGIAPEADLLLASTFDPGNQTGSLVPLLTWSVQQGADVMLHEYAPWTGYHLDGSSNHERLMDEAAARGVAQVNPVGNLGGSQKAMMASVPTRASRLVPVIVPEPQWWEEEMRFVQLSFLWRSPERRLHFALETPAGEPLDLGATGTPSTGVILSDGATMVYAWRDDSPRGTAKMEAWIFGQSGRSAVPVPRGTWRVTVSDPETADASAPDVTLLGYVADDQSSWGVGARFSPEQVSEQHLLCFPATADSAIGVAAYTGHPGAPYSGSDEPAGALRRYSGRGLRVDGAPVIDVAAPDNPVSATTRLDYGGGYVVPLGSYIVFGGTSGAGPHVAGAAALIKQVHPDWDGLQVREAIRAGALVDAQVTGDASFPVEQLWGAGKLRIYQTLYGQSPAPNTPPSVAFGDVTVSLGVPVQLRPEVADAEDPPDALSLRLDVGYDGTYEVGPVAAVDGATVTFDGTGTVPVKVQVVDTGGLTAEALARITVVSGPVCDGGLCPDGGTQPPPPGAGGCGCDAASPAGSLGAVLLVLLAPGLARKRRRRVRRRAG